MLCALPWLLCALCYYHCKLEWRLWGDRYLVCLSPPAPFPLAPLSRTEHKVLKLARPLSWWFIYVNNWFIFLPVLDVIHSHIPQSKSTQLFHQIHSMTVLSFNSFNDGIIFIFLFKCVYLIFEMFSSVRFCCLNVYWTQERPEILHRLFISMSGMSGRSDADWSAPRGHSNWLGTPSHTGSSD